MKDLFKAHKYALLLATGVFLLIYIFFSQIHPVYPYDADDWTYLFMSRGMYPSMGYYNPTRVLPEILMPLAGQISMSVVYPLVGDITLAVCYTSSFILALFITAYIVLFYRMLLKVTKLSTAPAFFLSLLFLALHFLFYKVGEGGNQYLFYSFDLCCHYNYTIPNLLAGIVVMLFFTDRFENFNIRQHPIRKGLLILLIYLSVFSHLFGSIILISYLSAYLVVKLIQSIREKKGSLNFVTCNVLHLSVIAAWLVGLCFEGMGNRANEVSEIANASFSSALKAAVQNFLQMSFYRVNTLTLVLIIVTIVTYVTVVLYKKELKEWRKHLIILFLSMVICSIFLVLLGAKTYPYYLLRAMTFYAVPFYALMIGLLCLALLVGRYRSLSFVLPFVLLLCCCSVNGRENTYLDIQTLNISQQVQGRYQIPPYAILQQNRDNIRAITEAARKGKQEATIYVPKFEKEDNWPITDYYGKRLSRFLDKYGVIRDEIKVTVIPDDSRFDNFQLDRTR